jgi:hypothetical protein
MPGSCLACDPFHITEVSTQIEKVHREIETDAALVEHTTLRKRLASRAPHIKGILNKIEWLAQDEVCRKLGVSIKVPCSIAPYLTSRGFGYSRAPLPVRRLQCPIFQTATRD